MAAFGAKFICFAPFAEQETENGMPTYSGGTAIGKLAAANLTVNLASGELWADDNIAEEVSEFASGAIAVELDDLSQANYALIYGATAAGENIKDAKADTIPFGGIGYYKTLMRKGVKYYKTFFYPKAKAVIGADNAATRAASITFQTTPITFNIYAPLYAAGQWRETEVFSDEASAVAWVKSKLNITTAYMMTVQVQGAGAGEGATPEFNTMVESGKDFVLTIAGTPNALYDNGADNVLDIAVGKYTVENVAADHKITVIF